MKKELKSLNNSAITEKMCYIKRAVNPVKYKRAITPEA